MSSEASTTRSVTSTSRNPALGPVVRSPARGTALIVVSSVFFSGSGPLGRVVMDAGLSPLQLASVRICSAAVLLLGVTALVRPRLLRITRATLPALLGYGLLGVAGVQVCYYVAVARLPVGVALLLEYLSPVLVTVWVRVVRRTVLPRAVWFGVALGLLGLALVARLWQGASLDGLGLLAGLGTAGCSAAYFLLGEHGASVAHPIGMAGWGLGIGAVVMTLVAPVWTVQSPDWTASTTLAGHDLPVWLVLAVIVLVATVGGYATGTAALRHLPSSVVSVLALVEPVAGIVFTWILLGQALSAVQLGGGALILTGALIVQLNSRRVGQLAVDPAEPTLS